MYYLVFEGWMNYAKSKPSKIIKRFSFDFAVIDGKNDNKSALLLQYRDKLSFFVRKNATEWRGMNKHATRHERGSCLSSRDFFWKKPSSNQK